MTLSDFFREHPKAAIAFSGGVDSAYLLYAAHAAGADVAAYYIKTAFQPRFELAHAKRLAAELGIPLRIVPVDIFRAERVTENSHDRCYFCKKSLFTALRDAARADGYDLLLDGTNFSDRADDRPGMRALKELSVRSPLRECELTKDVIRAHSKAAGLFTHDKPAYACLATRIPTGTQITREALQKTELAEEALAALGFSDFRVRLRGEDALLQCTAQDQQRALRERDRICTALKPYYAHIMLDLEVRP